MYMYIYKHLSATVSDGGWIFKHYPDAPNVQNSYLHGWLKLMVHAGNCSICGGAYRIHKGTSSSSFNHIEKYARQLASRAHAGAISITRNI